MDAHRDVIQSVEEMGAQLIHRVEDLTERERLGERLSHVSIRWRHLLGLADAVRWVFALLCFALQTSKSRIFTFFGAVVVPGSYRPFRSRSVLLYSGVQLLEFFNVF